MNKTPLQREKENASKAYNMVMAALIAANKRIAELESELRPSQYVEEAMAFASPNRGERFRELLDLVGLGMTGESGEVADLVKKHIHHGHPLDREKFIKELGDEMWYIALACDILGVRLEDVMATNIAKLRQRYPNGFSTEASIARVDESIA